jgi:hypothetical protein
MVKIQPTENEHSEVLSMEKSVRIEENFFNKKFITMKMVTLRDIIQNKEKRDA